MCAFIDTYTYTHTRTHSFEWRISGRNTVAFCELQIKLSLSWRLENHTMALHWLNPACAHCQKILHTNVTAIA